MPAASGRGDVLATTVYALFFTVGSGMAAVTFPLLALHGGLRASEIGVAVTAAALVQVVARAYLGRAMRRVPDRALLVVAAVAQLCGFAAVMFAASFEVLTAAWILQGVARACFWTGGQTHMVRGTTSDVGALALFNFVGGIGQFLGPLISGLLVAVNGALALTVGIAVSSLALVPAAVLERHDPFSPSGDPRASRLVREPGMRMACWGSVGAGTWRSLLDSFVPVVLESARHSSTVIGVLVSVSNGAAILGALAVGRIRRAGSSAIYVPTMIATAVGTGAIGLVAGLVPVAAVALAVSGFAAGMLQTLSPAIASSSVHADEKGDAIALSGMSRAVAMFGAPLIVTAAAAVVPVSVGLFGVGAALCVPAALTFRQS